MQNLSDNDIDKLFKQAADQQQPQFDPADWDDLKKRLDQPERAPSYFNWTSSVVLLGALVWLSWNTINSFEMERIAGVVKPSMEKKSTHINTTSRQLLNSDTTTFDQRIDGVTVSQEAKAKGAVVNNENELNSDEKNETTSVRESEPYVTTTKKIIKDSAPKDNVSRNKEQTTKRGSKNVALVKEVVATQTGNQVAVAEVSADNATTDKQGSLINLNDFKEKQPNELSANKILVTGSTTNDTNLEEKDLKDNVNSLNAVQNGITFPAAANTKNTVINNETDQKDSLVLINKELNEMKVASADKSADSLIKKDWLRHWAIKATISPDFSADQFKSVEKTGLNYGMMVEYFIHEKFSVSAGAIWSRKYYSAQDVAYGYYQADEVYGDCRMWDIPLNFTYYNSPSQQYSFFFTVGSSSYLMNEENYTYKVETGYGTVSYDKQVLKENNEWFKMLNLSVGVQKQFRKRWAIQLEPFIKVPLAGVGEGNIQLSSFGSFFSIRYKILDP